MNFLPDVYVLCEVCNGRRYNQETLAVKFNGYSIADLLDLPIEDALPILKDIPAVNQKLQTLVDVGLGYIHLGQSATTLSGGEAQRMKLARELSKRQTGRTLYLLDEPTTGLHFDDVRKLLEVLHRLTDLGNTVIIIEHNLDIIRNADYLIDMGPEGGEGGGTVVAQGTPEQVASVPASHTGDIPAPALPRSCNDLRRQPECGRPARLHPRGGRRGQRPEAQIRSQRKKDRQTHSQGARRYSGEEDRRKEDGLETLRIGLPCAYRSSDPDRGCRRPGWARPQSATACTPLPRPRSCIRRFPDPSRSPRSSALH